MTGKRQKLLDAIRYKSECDRVLLKRGTGKPKALIYQCKTSHPRLTVGKQYTEIMPNANACVMNDENHPEYIERDRFFTIKEKD